MKMFLAVLLALTLVVPTSAAFCQETTHAASQMEEKPPGHYALNEVTDKFFDSLSGDDMLLYDAFVYRGWRTSSGHWLDAVMVDLHEQLAGLGFGSQERTTDGNQGDSVWFQYEANTANTWNPQYASMKVVAAGAAASISDEELQRLKDIIEFEADCIDPTSMYYPAHVTAEWLYDATVNKGPGTPEYWKMQQVNKRVHLPTNAPFFAYTDPGKTPEENIAAGTRAAELVYVGTVNTSNNTNEEGVDPASLAGKIILSTTATPSTVRTYAESNGAIAALVRVNPVESANGNMPVIDGVRWYTNHVPFAGSAGTYVDPAPGVAVPMRVSLDQFGAFMELLSKGEVRLELAALGTYDRNQPVRCLIAEIQGSTKPQERILVPAHINEPGACDNASGVAMGIELARKMKQMIDSGELARPERTITFIWGDEIQMTNRYLAKYRAEFSNIKGMVNLDMVGEDPAKTGGPVAIDKTPDPANIARVLAAAQPFGVDPKFVYRYGNQTYPGMSPLARRYDYVRSPDENTVWNNGSPSNIQYNNFPGFYFNDLFERAFSLVQKENPKFEYWVKNPYEGGSDHAPLITATGNYGAPVPAAIVDHFPDYVYHSSNDTLDKLSAQEFKDVGVGCAAMAYQMANAGEYEAADAIDIVVSAWKSRMEWEKANANGHYGWLMANPAQGQAGSTQPVVNADYIAASYERELKCIADWSRWYVDAVRSAGKYFIGGAVGTPYSISAALQEKEMAAVRQIQDETVAVLDYVDAVFGKASSARPKQIASAYLPEQVFLPLGATRNSIESYLNDHYPSVTVEYIGGGTGTADVVWNLSLATSIMPNITDANAGNAANAGLYRVAGKLDNFDTGVENWAMVLAVGNVNVFENAVTPGVFIENLIVKSRMWDNVELCVDAASYDGGVLAYQWYANSNMSTVGGSPVAGATEARFAFKPNAAGTFYYYCEVTNTNPNAAGSKTAALKSNAVVLTVVPVSVGISVDPVSGIEGDIEYVISIDNAKDLLSVAIEFEVDGSMLAGKGAEALSGFAAIDGIVWKSLGGSVWSGAVTLGYPAGANTGFSVLVPTDIAKLVFAPRAKGCASVRLTSVKAVGLAEETTAFLDTAAESCVATTCIDQLVYSKYDLNKDNKVDALDLGIMLLYCGFDNDSPNWGTLVKVNDSKGKGVTASMCDVNSDGVIDMLDLLDLFIHYTK